MMTAMPDHFPVYHQIGRDLYSLNHDEPGIMPSVLFRVPRFGWMVYTQVCMMEPLPLAVICEDDVVSWALLLCSSSLTILPQAKWCGQTPESVVREVQLVLQHIR